MTIVLIDQGALQKWFDIETVEAIFIISFIVGILALQHAFLLVLVALYRAQVEPAAWLLTRSDPAIRAILHIAAFLIFAVGIALGFLLSSNMVLTTTLFVSLAVGFATELTFMGCMGPLASALEECRRIDRNRYR